MMNLSKTTFHSWRYLFMSGTLAIVLSACGGGGGNGGGIPEPDPNPDPTPDPTPGVTTGQVNFTPDWGTLPVSSALRIHFYSASGTVITKDIDASGFNDELEAGMYKVLAYNTDATCVRFENTDSYSTAAVGVTSAEVPTRGTSVINQPDKVYALTMENLLVEKGGVVNQKSIVRNLVKPLALSFNIDDGSIISSLRGHLNGFFPSVLLSTGKPSAEASGSSIETGVKFNVVVNGNDGSANLSCLGMLDPQNGNIYKCTLLLDITTVDGLNAQTTVDLSEVLTRILAENNGVLPDSVPAGITIKLEVVSNSEIAFQGSIIDWVKGEDSKGVVL